MFKRVSIVGLIVATAVSAPLGADRPEGRMFAARSVVHARHGMVADADGNMVSLIQSNYTGFGSGYAVEGWGFGLQDRGGLFSLNPASPNALDPGKRPFHTIIPAFATRDGLPWIAFVVMGGDMQPQGHVQVIVNLVDFGMNLQEAGDAARLYHTGSSEPTGTPMTTGGILHLESGVPAEVWRGTRSRAFTLARANPARTAARSVTE